MDDYCNSCGKTNVVLTWLDGRGVCADCQFMEQVWEKCKGCLTMSPREIYEVSRLAGLVA